MSAEQAAMLHLQPQPVLPTPEKRWYDRVVDSILGEDPCKLYTCQLWAFMSSPCTSSQSVLQAAPCTRSLHLRLM